MLNPTAKLLVLMAQPREAGALGLHDPNVELSEIEKDPDVGMPERNHETWIDRILGRKSKKKVSAESAPTASPTPSDKQ